MGMLIKTKIHHSFLLLVFQWHTAINAKRFKTKRELHVYDDVLCHSLNPQHLCRSTLGNIRNVYTNEMPTGCDLIGHIEC